MKPGIDYVGICTPFYCNDGNGLFLLSKRSRNARDEHGRWDPGSGLLELGLTPEQNVVREIKEEYGCKNITIQEAVPVHTIFRLLNGIKTHWVAIPFFVLVDPKEVRNNEPNKFETFSWFSLDKLPKPLHSGFLSTFKRYQSLFQKYIKH